MLSSEEAPINTAKSLSLPKWSSPMHDEFRTRLHNPSSHAKSPLQHGAEADSLLILSLSCSPSSQYQGQIPTLWLIFCSACFNKSLLHFAVKDLMLVQAGIFLHQQNQQPLWFPWVLRLQVPRAFLPRLALLCLHASGKSWVPQGSLGWEDGVSGVCHSLPFPATPGKGDALQKNPKPSELSLPESAWGQCSCGYWALCPGSLVEQTHQQQLSTNRTDQ